MMERNYPSSSFSDPLAPAAQSAAWAYERAGLKPSLSYGAGHAEAELLHRQAYTAAQLPAYSATHHPAGLAGLFDTSLHGAGINTTETSVMNFLSAIESRTAASSGATLLPQFRASSWQTGMHSSADLFVTGALPTSGTFPPTSAYSAYQHPSSFSSRNFVSTPSLSLQDGTFSATSNGILTHDPLLQLKTSQCAIPTALTFDRLSSSMLASSLPIQSSTYRSAQESAPHLLQPQYSLLPSALAGAQQASQAYSTAVFAGSPASIERALQRECSVIKHHQRPSSSQSVQAQLAGSHHSLQTYLPSVGGINFHDTTRQSTLSCSPLVDITQVSNGGLAKTSRVTVELAQSYTSAIPSSGYPLSSVKGKNCSTKPPPVSTKTSKPQNVVLPVQTQSYNKSAQSSVIASQAQIYSSAQLPNLLAVSQSQTYVSTQSPNSSTVSDSRAFSPLKQEKLPLLYKSNNTFSNLSQAITSDSQTLSYSAGQQHSLPLSSNESYSDQGRNITTPSQNYTSNQPQGLSPISQSPVNYTSQSHRLSISPSVSYTSRQHLTSPAPLPFSASSGAQNMSGSSPNSNYISMASSQNSQSQDSTSSQSQTFSPAVKSPFASPTHSHVLQNNRLDTDAKSYVSKRKLQSSVYSPPKQDTDFAMQDLQALQQQTSLESSTQRLAGGGMNDQESAYRIPRTDERYHSPSVIRSSSRLDQGVFSPLRSKTDERLVSSVSQLSQQIDHIDSMASNDLKHSGSLMQTSHEPVQAEELNLQNHIQNKVHKTKDEEHPIRGTCSSSQVQTPTLSHPLSDSPCDLHMLQPSFLHSDYRQAKTPTLVLQSHNLQHITPTFLQLDSHIIANSGGQQHPHQQSSENLKDNITCPPKVLQSQQLTTNDNFRHPDQHDSKNQFLPLGSICFSESMLLPDERNILSNVDDILAATAAACGLSTQEFDKVSSDEETQSVENIHESKANCEMSVRHDSPSFTPSQAPVPPHESTTAVLPNSGQMQQSTSPLDTIQSNVTSDRGLIDMPDQNVASGMGSPTFKTDQEEQDPITVPRAQCTNNENIHEDNDVRERSCNYTIGNPDLSSSTASVGEETAVSDDDTSMCVDSEKVGSNETNVLMLVNLETQPCANSLILSESENQDTTQDNLHTDQKMENNSKSPVSEDESANENWQNSDLQAKRLISKGIDLSLPCSPSDIAESYFDSSQHQERIRQKIKEVEEQQPEVKCGFIGSFLDFLKGDPKIPTSKAPNRAKRPAAILRAPFLQHVPFKNLPLMNPLSPQDSVVTKTEKEVDDGLKKNLETLPSFSSDDDSGGVRDLQKSLSTALSDLDHADEIMKKTEPTKVTVAPSVKKEPFCVSSPVIKVEENPKAIESPKLPDIDISLARKQDTVAFLGLTDDEESDSGGEGTFRERDEFVVKLDDIEALQLCLSTGEEPPAIWRVQKALLQKFVPELRYGIRQYSATNSYLGYFGDTKTKYKRVYAKFIENANKKEYVRLCSRKPKPKPAQPARTGLFKVAGGNKASESPASKAIATKGSSMKSKAKQPKLKAEPPPKKRKTWKGEFSSPSDMLPEVKTEENGSVCNFISLPKPSTPCATVQSIPVAMDVDPPPVEKEAPLILQETTEASKPPPPALIQPPLAVIQPTPALIHAPTISKQPPAALKPAPAKRAPAKRAPAKRTPAKRAPLPPKQAPQRPLTEMQPDQSLSENLLPLTEKPQSPTADQQLLQSLPIEESLPQSLPLNKPESQLPSLDKKHLQSPYDEEQTPQSPPPEKQLPQTPPADKQPPLTPKKSTTPPKQSVITPETSPIPFASRSLRTRAMKETFRSYMELLVSVALDADTMHALEKNNDELLLPHMRKIEGMINEGCGKVLEKLNLTQSHKNALETFPELTVMTRENKSKKGGPPISKIKVNGKAYNKKTLRNTKSNKSSQEFTVDPSRTQLCSLYHSLHHYRYHVYLICKDEIATVVKANADLGQEQIVQLCMKNMTWVETLFERFGELLSEVQEKCG